MAILERKENRPNWIFQSSPPGSPFGHFVWPNNIVKMTISSTRLQVSRTKILLCLGINAMCLEKKLKQSYFYVFILKIQFLKQLFWPYGIHVEKKKKVALPLLQ